MAKVTLFMFSEAIQPEPSSDGKIIQILKNPIPVIRPHFIPSNFSFGISFAIQDIELNIENRINIIIKDPSGNLILNTINTKFKSDESDTLPQEYQGLMLCANFSNVVFNIEGRYIVQIILNDAVIYEHDLPVFKRNDTK